MRKTYTPLVASLLLGTVLLPSCATIISSPMQSVKVVGQPAGSTYYVNNKEVKSRPVSGTDAVKVKVHRNKTSEITVKHEGYKDYSEMLYPDKHNPFTYLNYLPIIYWLSTGINELDDNGEAIEPNRYAKNGWAIGGGGFLVDFATGANRRLNKNEIKPTMMVLPKAAATTHTIQCGLVNVRIKGGDKMGNLYIKDDPTEILNFGKSLDVEADHLKSTVNSSLKDLGYNVPSSEGRSMFATGSNSRYTLQGEMRDIKYDIHASHKYESYARFETHCTVEVTWKLVNQNRQTVFEQKASGKSIKFERGGSAVFEDAFENSLYAFLATKEAAATLTKTGAAAKDDDKQPAITVHRAALPKLTTDNGVSTAARCVVIIETGDGHGSGCIISSDGYIITNAHVVEDLEKVKVLSAEGLEMKGEVIRVNPEMDLALIKVDADGLQAFQLPTTNMADIGADVFAIGTPADKELGQSISKGIISGRRKIEGRSFLQTDVSINGGNSGGALVSRSGQLLGIVNAKLVGRGIEGIGFAIPAEQVSEALQLKFVD